MRSKTVLFNSYEFIFIFLPLTVIMYFLIQKTGHWLMARVWILAASLFFYSWWNIAFLPLLLGSILFNYSIGSYLSKTNKGFSPRRKPVLLVGLIGNLGLLGYFKYADFFINNINMVLAKDFTPLNIVLPLGISFFTFQQIAYLVDSYREETPSYSLVDYAIFVAFFPQLIAGPIVHHQEMINQFQNRSLSTLDYKNVSTGLYVFIIGLAKKVLIADTFAVWASYGFDQAVAVSFLEAWLVSISYTLQLYFDFSAYNDMAIGVALMFNIKLPYNFFSPYKSLNIQDFWRRWHITLGRFLRNYIYIPLGGNRRGNLALSRNLLITFLLGGLWHGAGWTFVFWGFLHGMALVVHRGWQKTNLRLNSFISWFITFNFVNLAWVFFRALTWSEALKVLKGMVAINNIVIPSEWSTVLSTGWTAFKVADWGLPHPAQALGWVVIGMLVCVFIPNSMQLKEGFKAQKSQIAVVAALAVLAILRLLQVSEFLYFNF